MFTDEDDLPLKEDIKLKVKHFIQDKEKVFKYAGYAIAGVVSVYLLGLVFRILAHSVRGLNDFKLSIHGK